jgi:hypothetical protein
VRYCAALRSGTDDTSARIMARSGGILDGEFEREPATGADYRHTVPHSRGRPATLRFHRTAAKRNEWRGGARLCARTLLAEQKFSASVVDVGRADVDDTLQRKTWAPRTSRCSAFQLQGEQDALGLDSA